MSWEREDELAMLGIRMAMQINREVDGPRTAVAVLAIMMGRVLCEFPEKDWPRVFREFEEMAIAMMPGIDEMLIHERNIQ